MEVAQLVGSITLQGAQQVKSDLQSIQQEAQKTGPAFDGATRSVQQAGTQVQRTGQEVQQTTNKIRQMHSEAGRSPGIFGGMAKGIAGASAAIVGAMGLEMSIGLVIDKMKDWTKGAMQAQTATAQTVQILQSASHVMGVTSEQVDKLSMSLSNLTGIDEDVIHSAENVLLGFKNISQQAFPQATQAALDMSRALGIDATQAATILGRALQDPERGARMLRSANIILSASQQEQIKKMEQQGNIAGAQAVVMQAVTDKYKGMAAAIANTPEGKLQKFQTTLDNVGKALMSTLLPAFSSLLDAITPLISVIGNALGPLLEKLSPIIQKAVGVLSIWWGFLGNVLNVLATVLGFVIDGISNVVSWVQGKLTPVISALHNWLQGKLAPVLVAVGEYFTRVGQNAAIVGGWIQTNLLPPLTFAGGILLWIGETAIAGAIKWFGVLGTVIGWLGSHVVQPVFAFVGQTFGNAVRAAGMLAQGVGNAFSALGRFIAPIWTGIGHTVESAINAMIDMVNRFLGFLGGISIPIPSVNLPGVGQIGGGSFGFGSMPQIPHVSLGGIAGAVGGAIGGISTAGYANIAGLFSGGAPGVGGEPTGGGGSGGGLGSLQNMLAGLGGGGGGGGGGGHHGGGGGGKGHKGKGGKGGGAGASNTIPSDYLDVSSSAAQAALAAARQHRNLHGSALASAIMAATSAAALAEAQKDGLDSTVAQAIATKDAATIALMFHNNTVTPADMKKAVQEGAKAGMVAGAKEIAQATKAKASQSITISNDQMDLATQIAAMIDWQAAIRG